MKITVGVHAKYQGESKLNGALSIEMKLALKRCQWKPGAIVIWRAAEVVFRDGDIILYSARFSFILLKALYTVHSPSGNSDGYAHK